MAQPKVTRKPGRHHRRHQSEHLQQISTPCGDAPPQTVQENDNKQERASDLVPALLPGASADEPAQADASSSAEIVIQQRFPVVYEQPRQVNAGNAKRTIPNAVSALLISGGVTAALILALGVLHPNRNEMQVTQAVPDASLVALAPKREVEGQAGDRGVMTKAGAGKFSADTGANRIKQALSMPRTEKKSGDSRIARSASSMEKTKTKPASAMAKKPRNPVEDRPAPVLAQNRPTPVDNSSGIGRYEQCQEIGNFFRREQCKWQVCNGKWGQEGCPAYPSASGDIGG